MPYTLRDIPASMRKEGWNMGAQLMDRWLDAPAWQMSDPVKRGDAPAPARAVDADTVKMEWLLGFARVQSAYQHLLQSWSEPPRLERSAKQVEMQFRRWLAVNPRAPGTCFRFGDFARPVTEVNEHYAINIEIVDSPWYRVVDDFYAAFGKALLKLAISALAEQHGNKWRLSIDQVGVFYVTPTISTAINRLEAGDRVAFREVRCLRRPYRSILTPSKTGRATTPTFPSTMQVFVNSEADLVAVAIF